MACCGATWSGHEFDRGEALPAGRFSLFFFSCVASLVSVGVGEGSRGGVGGASGGAGDGERNAAEEEEEEDEGAAEEEMRATVDRLAELALLGRGDADRLFPDAAEEMAAAYAGETPWRVML